MNFPSVPEFLNRSIPIAPIFGPMGIMSLFLPSETQPVVNLSLNTDIQQYNVFMRFNGPIDQVRTNYSSDLSLAAADVINLLAFGSTTEANIAHPSTPAAQAAQSWDLRRK